MRKNLMKLAALAGLALVGQLAATDFRAPIATQMGPLHYSFDKLHKKKSNLTFFTTGHFRETNEAYMSHGTDKHPLSQLIFGKSEFYISEAFENGGTYEFGLTENLNPHLKTIKLAPRVSYTEMGVFFGASWDYPVWNNKGRVGIRGSLPIRWVRMERDQEKEEGVLGYQTDVIKNEIRYVKPFNPDGTPGRIMNASSYRLELLRGMGYVNDDGTIQFAFDPFLHQGQPAAPSIGSALYGISSDKVKYYGRQGGADPTLEGPIPFVVIRSNNPGLPPYHQGGALLVGPTGAPASGQYLNNTKIIYPTTFTAAGVNPEVREENVELVNLPETGSGPAVDRAAAFSSNTDYKNLFAPQGSTSGTCCNPCYDPCKTCDPCDPCCINNKDLWITSIHGSNGIEISPVADSGVKYIDDLLMYYSDDMGEWLRERGFVMTTDETTSLGDIPVELFYEHSFNDSWRGELCFGVKFPTGCGGSDYTGNPFSAQTGNGSHWELKIGGLVAWQALRCMNVKLDLAYNFALSDTEQRAAVYKCSCIKNFGPCAEADVDWGYFVGNLDFNFIHPKSKKIMGMIGYQLYYKTEDKIDFKCPSPCETACQTSCGCPTDCDKYKNSTWLGKLWTDASGKAASSTVVGTQWSDFKMNLDSQGARRWTEQWGHRLRLEGTYKLSKYCITSVGALYTFAGQNIPVEADIHCACKVNF
jgi:hypothetical protein